MRSTPRRECRGPIRRLWLAWRWLWPLYNLHRDEFLARYHARSSPVSPCSGIKRVFGGRPGAIMGASPGPYGTILAQQAWLGVLRTLGTRPWFGGRMQVSRAGQTFNDNGDLVDEKVSEQLKEYLRGFSAFIAECKRG